MQIDAEVQAILKNSIVNEAISDVKFLTPMKKNWGEGSWGNSVVQIPTRLIMDLRIMQYYLDKILKLIIQYMKHILLLLYCQKQKFYFSTDL